jgi:hypothetical protein
MNTKLRTIILIISQIAFSNPSTVFAAQVDDVLAVKAIGGKNFDGRNDNGNQKYDFSRGNHRLRLEDVEVHREGNRFYGTFTMTNRRRMNHDPHIFVIFDIANGKVSSLKMKADGGKNWWDVLSKKEIAAAAAVAPEATAVASAVKGIAGIVNKLGVNGDAQVPMAQAIELIIMHYGVKSSPAKKE